MLPGLSQDGTQVHAAWAGQIVLLTQLPSAVPTL